MYLCEKLKEAMNPQYYINTLIITLVGLSSCTSPKSTSEGTITASIAPVKYIVEQIVGNDFNIEVMVPAGASPESYEPTPGQLVALDRSVLIFTTGLMDFEQNVIRKCIENSSQSKHVNLSEGIDVITDNNHVHSGPNGEKLYHGADPHIWTSPTEMKIMARNAYDKIAETYPDSVKYADNYRAFLSRLEALDTEIRDMVESSPAGYFIIYHPALTYYSRTYGIEQVSLENEGKEPSAEYLVCVIRRARQDGIKSIFYQRQFSQTTVETVAKDLSVEMVEINHLAEEVADNLIYITKLICR